MTVQLLQFLDVNPQQTFGAWLRSKRIEGRWSLEAVATKAGISKQYLSVLERGEPHTLTGKAVRPKVELVEKLAKALQVDPDEARLAAGYAAQPRKAKTAKEALEIMEKLVPGFEGILTAEGITDENAQRILDDFLTVIELHKRRNG